MNPRQVSERTRASLERLTPERRARAEAIIARMQTSEARAAEAVTRDSIDREYRETGTIATTGERFNDRGPWRGSGRP